MAKVLNKEQELLIDYFARIGLSLAETLALTAEVWHPRSAAEMIEYILETECTEYDQLLETACRISQKHEPEWMDEDLGLEEE